MQDNTIYFPIYPQLDTKKTYHSCEYKYDKQMNPTVHHEYKVCFNKDYLFDVYNRGVTPVVRVYKAKGEEFGELVGTLSPYMFDINNRKADVPEFAKPSLTVDAVYYFQYDSKGDPLYLVPALLDKEDNRISEFRIQKIPFGVEGLEPKIEVVHSRLVSATGEYDDESDCYEFEVIIKLSNPDKVKELGYYVTIEEGGTSIVKDLCYTAVKADGDPMKPGTYKLSNWLYMSKGYREYRDKKNVTHTPIMSIYPYIVYLKDGNETEIKTKYPAQIIMKCPWEGSLPWSGEVNFNVELNGVSK